MNPAPSPSRAFALLAAMLAGLISLRAADAPPPRAPIRANVESIDDVRSTMSSAGCRVTAVLFGEDLDDVAGIIEIRVTKAIDNLGHSLVSEVPDEGTYRPTPALRLGAMRMPLRATFTLRNPARRATEIRDVEAVLKLYRPSEANGAILTLPSPVAHVGTPVTSDALEKLRIGMEYVGTDMAPAFAGPLTITGGLVQASPAAEQVRLESVAAEVARRRVMREQMAAAANSGAAKASLASGPMTHLPVLPPSKAQYRQSDTLPSSHLSPPTRYRAIFRVSDPDHRLAALEWRDASGLRPPGTFPSVIGQYRTLTSTEQPQPDWKLVAYVVTDQAVDSETLHLENVALP